MLHPNSLVESLVTRKPNKGQTYERAFVIDKVMDHTFENASYLFSVRRYENTPVDNGLEPMDHLPRRHIVRYFRTRNFFVPTRRAFQTAMPV